MNSRVIRVLDAGRYFGLSFEMCPEASWVGSATLISSPWVRASNGSHLETSYSE